MDLSTQSKQYLTVNTRTVIFSLSGVYDQMGMTSCQGPFTGAQTISMSSLEGTCCYCDDEAAASLRDAMDSQSLCCDSPAICWIDSGDYHYMSLFRTETIGRPFQLLLIDNHPDMQEPLFSDVLSCGGWLRRLLETNPNLVNVVLVGVNPQLMSETEGFESRLSSSLLDDIPVFISIDKDALNQDESRTNWDQGEMTVGSLEKTVADAAEGREVIGIDVCGEKPSSKGGDAEDMHINLNLNLRLQKFLNGLMA